VTKGFGWLPDHF